MQVVQTLLAGRFLAPLAAIRSIWNMCAETTNVGDTTVSDKDLVVGYISRTMGH